MKSSSGAHFLGLDHIRALAAFLVFSWHFMHSTNGYPVPFNSAPAVVPFALIDEGHTGVALFMCLSGYLFAKLIADRPIVFSAFVFNRILRLLPLLLFVILLRLVQTRWQGGDLHQQLINIAKGLVLPTLPNGGWSVTAEFHFYLLLPFLLWLKRHSPFWLACLLLSSTGLRTILWWEQGEIQFLAYFTLIGRIDQFVLGILAWHWRQQIAGKHLIACICLLTFALGYAYFDSRGGFVNMPSFPSPSPLWIVMPTLEGLAFGLGIAWYDSSFVPSNKGISGFIAKLGAYSYSIYLMHFFFVFELAHWIDRHLMPISNFYFACAWSLVSFCMMWVVGSLCFRYIESPWLRFRVQYIK